MVCGERKSDSSVIASLNRNTSGDRSLCCRSTLPSHSYVPPFLFLTFHPPPPPPLLSPRRIFSSYLQKFACKSRNECVSVRITNRKRFSYSPFIKSEPTRTHRGRTLDPISASSLPFLLFPLCFPSTCVFVLRLRCPGLSSFLLFFLLSPSLHFYMLAAAAAGSTRLGSII